MGDNAETQDLTNPAVAYQAGMHQGKEIGRLEMILEQSGTDARPLTPMERVIETALAEAGKGLPDGEVAAVQCQVIFGDGSGHAGALKRGAFPGTYVIANQAMVQRDPRQQPQPVEGKIAEMIFLGRDVARIITIRDVPVSLVGGDPRSKLWVPGS